MSKEVSKFQPTAPNQTLKESSKNKQKQSTSSSEFVFNPDPDFLAKINANIRMNNQVGGQVLKEEPEDEVYEHQDEEEQEVE